MTDCLLLGSGGQKGKCSGWGLEPSGKEWLEIGACCEDAYRDLDLVRRNRRMRCEELNGIWLEIGASWE